MQGKRPVQQHRKPWPLEQTRTYRPWMEGVDYPSGGGALRAELHGNSALDWGDLHIPWAASPSKVVRTEEALGLFRAEKGALLDLVTSSCTSGKKGTGGGCRRSACAPRNQSSSLERSGEGRGLQCSPTLSAARESIAVSSGSDSGNATLPDGGSAAKSSSPEPSSSPDTAIDVCHLLVLRT